jgi:hypothetical protein
MNGSSTRIWFAIVCLCGLSIPVRAQQQPVGSIRPPATPLVVHDPYFSIWSNADRLTGGPTRHWTGVPQQLNGLIRVDTKTYRYLGNADGSIPAMEETDRKITPTRTVVTLQSPEIELTLMFPTPAFPGDIRMMARPITYLTWNVKSHDGGKHQVGFQARSVVGGVYIKLLADPELWSKWVARANQNDAHPYPSEQRTCCAASFGVELE